ncbi:hypothetical protein SAMN02910275_02250 [Butyrivibrio sp. INlla18]|nr:hypothetical protein [Butyrivibrio sp. INlla18]SDA70292.1 hypothetical protein SAMN02910275_02250 [Butyrivibrio sp. INlla18]
MEAKKEKKTLLSNSIKAKLNKVRMINICYYEGCGADDGWPE